MARAPLSVFVLGSPATTPASAGTLDALRRELLPTDQVVLVDCPPALRLPGATRTDLPADGPAGLVAGARHDAVLLVAAGRLLPAHALDAFAAALADGADAVGGAGNVGPAGQREHAAPDTDTARAAVRSFARDRWSARRGAPPVAAGALDAGCLALRRDAAAALTWSAGEVTGTGARLWLLPAVYVHALDAPGAPLVSACIIAKDEQEQLPRLLASLVGAADEVVVYDTGSSDRTRELAAAAGATVVEGYWDQDFAAARNRALAHCTGRWILWLDADEELVADPEALRAVLRSTGDTAYRVRIDNLEGNAETGELSTQHQACRVFRRSAGRWQGRLHEVVVDPAGRQLVCSPHVPATIRHYGYLEEVYRARDKSTRNLAIARAAVDAAGEAGRDHALAHFARAALAAGRATEARDAAARVGSRDRALRMTALLVLCRACAALGDPAGAWAAVAELDRISVTDIVSRHLQVRLLAAQGRIGEALAIADALPEAAPDDLGFEYRREHLAALVLELRAGSGDPAQLDRALADLASMPGYLPVPPLLAALTAAGRPLGDLVRVVDDRQWRLLAAGALNLDPEPADDLLEAMWQHRPGDTLVLSAAGRIGARLPLLRALEWSHRLRAVGAAASCPLLALARSQDRPVRERVLAAAIAAQSFTDPAAQPMLVDLLPAVPAEQAATVLAELRMLAPSLVG